MDGVDQRQNVISLTVLTIEFLKYNLSAFALTYTLSSKLFYLKHINEVLLCGVGKLIDRFTSPLRTGRAYSTVSVKVFNQEYLHCFFMILLQLASMFNH